MSFLKLFKHIFSRSNNYCSIWEHASLTFINYIDILKKSWPQFIYSLLTVWIAIPFKSRILDTSKPIFGKYTLVYALCNAIVLTHHYSTGPFSFYVISLNTYICNYFCIVLLCVPAFFTPSFPFMNRAVMYAGVRSRLRFVIWINRNKKERQLLSWTKTSWRWNLGMQGDSRGCRILLTLQMFLEL